MDTKVKADISQLRIDGERLWASLMELAQIGATPKGGVCRLALTELDRRAATSSSRWCREAGLTITIDEIGNSFVRRPGRNNALPPVMTGSHLDTQPTGGKFDGCYGVLAGARSGAHAERPRHRDRGADRGRLVDQRGRHALRADHDRLGRVRRPSRWSMPTPRKDVEGKTVEDELDAHRLRGARRCPAARVGAYFEAHIEQGPVLEDDGMTIGVVTGVLGLRWFDCTVTGMDAHAGPTPMRLRKDAMLVAARLMQAVNRIALAPSAARAARWAWCR